MEQIDIRNKNCIGGLLEMKESSVDLILTDPPYNASNTPIVWKEKYWKSVNEEWDKIEDIDKFNEEWIMKLPKVMKEGASLFIFCSHHNLFSCKNVLDKTDLRFRNVLTWYAPDSMPMKRAYLGYFAYASQFILFYTKGQI